MTLRGGSTALVISCEHAGAQVPARYKSLFADDSRVLRTHCAYDIGAVGVAQALGQRFSASPQLQRLSRLLIDCNRSPHHPRLFSAYSRGLSAPERSSLLEAYASHRSRVLKQIAQKIRTEGMSVHVAVHSFTPVLDGIVRNCDIGLLYDPRRDSERALCRHWQRALELQAPQLRVRRNYPYQGRADGLMSTARKQWSVARYVGVELEINQQQLARFGKDGQLRAVKSRPDLVGILAETLRTALTAWCG